MGMLDLSPSRRLLGLRKCSANRSEVSMFPKREEYEDESRQNCECNPGLDDVGRGIGSGNIRARCARNVTGSSQVKVFLEET